MKYFLIILSFCLLNSCTKETIIVDIPDEGPIKYKDVVLKFITYSNNKKYKLTSNPISFKWNIDTHYPKDTNNWSMIVLNGKLDTFYKHYYSNDTIQIGFFNYLNDYSWNDTARVQIFLKDSIIYKKESSVSITPNYTTIIIPKK
jgi:hypothetical protein